MSLLNGKDPSLTLVQPTIVEMQEQQYHNSEIWKGALSREAYLRREEFLGDQALTRNGGLTAWALVHHTSSGRTVLSSCETLRKKGLIARDGRVDDVVCHGIGSVFCRPANRGRGYAGRMMKELGERLQTWQADQRECLFTVLYSDIGKQFYAANGWHPFPSAHISLNTRSSIDSDLSLPETRPLTADDMAQLCTVDEQIMRKRLEALAKDGKTAVAIVPDVETTTWQQAREDFVANELYDKSPEVKGAIVGDEPGKRVWCTWARFWYNPDPKDSKDNSLYILRLVVEDLDFTDFAPASDERASAARESYVTKATAALLAAAQVEASKWTMGTVDVWNPSSTTLAASRMLQSQVQVKHRDMDSITSLRWYGSGSEGPPADMDWISNEKYAWC